jgi:transcriptional regulator GlxA family with amidase domain
MNDTLQVVIPLFPRVTALDAVGPYEVLQRIPSVDVTFIGHRCGEVRTENGLLGLTVDGTFDQRVRAWVRRAHASTRLTTSVCTGSLVLGAAGLLDGLTATTHWACYPELAATGAIPTDARVVEHVDERIITAAGVSSGIDMALRLVQLLVDATAAQAAQLMIEYDPEPPCDTGSLSKADEVIVNRAIEYARLRS